MEPLGRQFYSQPTIKLARGLLGKSLLHRSEAGLTGGLIVETEAYLGSRDPASHASAGPTNRNRAMFGPPGRAYIYFTYGLHWCFNVTAMPKGVGEAVLIRALEPTEGIELMQRRRLRNDIRQLASGPGKLVQAMGIARELYGHDLTQAPLWIAPGKVVKAAQIAVTPRVGIRHNPEAPLRFYIKDNPFVSRG